MGALQEIMDGGMPPPKDYNFKLLGMHHLVKSKEAELKKLLEKFDESHPVVKKIDQEIDQIIEFVNETEEYINRLKLNLANQRIINRSMSYYMDKELDDLSNEVRKIVKESTVNDNKRQDNNEQ